MFEESPLSSSADLPAASSQPERSTPLPTLKRPASPSPEADTSRKRKKMNPVPTPNADLITQATVPTPGLDLETELAQELECPCCSALVYKPVVVDPCQHFFCGSCCYLWIQNGGTTCPACRGASKEVKPSRPIQVIIDAYLRACPSQARSERERSQADEIYRGSTMRFPSPRESSPPPDINISREYMRPCPHCSPGNPYGWSCPHPIPDPSLDLDNAWHVEDGLPPGHIRCGHCESLMATGSPVATRCDFCLVSFCGVTSQARCCARPIGAQEPHSLTDLGDFIQSTEIYECFDGNSHEVEILLDYLATQEINPRYILNEIVQHYRQSPNGFQLLFETGVFVDMWPVDPGVDPDPSAPRRYSCRMCAAELLLSGLRDWWIRERQKGLVKQEVLSREDCPCGSACNRQTELAHAKEFNHILMPIHGALLPPSIPPPAPSASISVDYPPAMVPASVTVRGSTLRENDEEGQFGLAVHDVHPHGDAVPGAGGNRLTALSIDGVGPTYTSQPASEEAASAASGSERPVNALPVSAEVEPDDADADADIDFAPPSSDADSIRVDHLVRLQTPTTMTAFHLVPSGTH